MLRKPKRKRLCALICALLLFVSVLVPSADAANVTVSTVNTTYYFLTYASNGQWITIGTPMHNINETGQVAYCLQMDKVTPQNSGYTSAGAYDILDETTLNGLRAILQNGYPAKTGGFPEDQARYATANAIRFWLAERGIAGNPSWMNYSAYSYIFCPISGYEALFNWCISLLQLAKDQSTVVHAIQFSNRILSLTQEDENYFTGQFEVWMYNCNGGYELDTSQLPSGSTVEGYTGREGDVLTVRIPVAYENQSFTLKAIGKDNRTDASLFFYAPNNGNEQRVLAYDVNVFGDAVTSEMEVTTPAARIKSGSVTVVKTDADTGAPLPGATYRIINGVGTALMDRATDANGRVTFNDLPLGGYHYQEIAAPDGFVLDDTLHLVWLTEDGQVLEEHRTNSRPTGSLTIYKKDADTGAALGNVGFRLYNSAGEMVQEGYTDSYGKLTFSKLKQGNYTYQEFAPLNGYAPDTASYPVNITEGQLNVTETRTNQRQMGSLSVHKVNAAGTPLAGTVFCLETSADGNSWSVASEKTTDEAGNVSFPDLYADTTTQYRLTEIQTVPGQSLQPKPIYQGTLPRDGILDLSFTVCNTELVRLPFTGSWGLVLCAMASTLMLGMGFFLIQKSKTKKEKS